MRGHDDRPGHLFSYVSPEQRVPADHPLRAIGQMTDRVLVTLSQKFARMYSDIGRPSIAPEKLLRALLLQVLYTVRSERLLMEQLDYNLLFRWFVGLNMDDAVWDPTVFSKNRDRLLNSDIAALFFQGVLFAKTPSAPSLPVDFRRDTSQDRSRVGDDFPYRPRVRLGVPRTS